MSQLLKDIIDILFLGILCNDKWTMMKYTLNSPAAPCSDRAHTVYIYGLNTPLSVFGHPQAPNLPKFYLGMLCMGWNTKRSRGRNTTSITAVMCLLFLCTAGITAAADTPAGYQEHYLHIWPAICASSVPDILQWCKDTCISDLQVWKSRVNCEVSVDTLWQ